MRHLCIISHVIFEECGELRSSAGCMRGFFPFGRERDLDLGAILDGRGGVDDLR